MTDIFSRLYRIARSKIPRPQNFFKKFESGADRPFDDSGAGNRQSRSYNGEDSNGEKNNGVPGQVAEDLGVFNLVPPSSLEQVRQARNREIKKYHPDRFLNHPEKLETAKEILQIYNAAYGRLRSYYENK
ncbi:hypothetical protein DENIS_2260 [Desulfonema ishimotonii]|uniref:J domain-containing protein n=1 Tax=Desulfonema ishimotonii TaxID=45657 RepID=A0A401FWG5_9BACT|nr:hypothetical protein [Desulfonema ishimotonii]GBC61300.1 hypothetical protein DENIS_2260 [Desulfonema ishimotonii]